MALGGDRHQIGGAGEKIGHAGQARSTPRRGRPE
jgi:hypothetical protein